MSRSNPGEHTPNPAVRWFEWNGEAGTVRYYDKDAKQNVDVGSDFTFILLDQLGSVRGWHDPSQSGIYSNEVRDTRQDVMVVKSFKGGIIAEGLYKDIKDRVNVAGGQFVANCYIAFKQADGLAIGSIRFKGAALGSWMEFCKSHRAEIYKGAIRIHGFTEDKKGRIVFRMPVLKTAPLAEATDAAAVKLDKELQQFLDGYLARNTRERVEHAATTSRTQEPPDDDGYVLPMDDSGPAGISDSDIPF